MGLPVRPARPLVLIFVLAPLCGQRTLAQGPPPRIKASRMAKPPTLDGQVDPTEWKDAIHVDRFVDPFTGLPASDQTEGWVGFDDEAIYVAFVCHDGKPDGIVGREIRPGAEFSGEDTVTFRINPFGTRGWDGRSRFTVNVLNTQNEEIAGGRSAKREWRGDWQSATSRTPDGWSAEFRIPWAMLNYPAGQGRRMDINLERWQARTQVHSRWANTTPADRPDYSGFWEEVDPPAQNRRRQAQFLAYSAPEYDHGRLSLRSGLDVRYPITSTVTALASLNPDFRNIEQQVAGIDFTRTERYLDEVRPFFTEGSEFFSLTEGYSFGRMFYPTGRIPTFDYGAKVYGKVTPTLSAGALTTVDTGHSTASVARVEKAFGPKANVSAYTTRLSEGGRENNVYGMNAFARRGSFNVDMQVASEAYEGERADVAGAVSLAYDVPRWFSIFRQQWVPEDFAPPLAFIPWTDRVGWYNYSEYSNEYRTGRLRSFSANVYSTDYRTYDGDLQQRGSEGYMEATLRNDTQLSVSHSHMEYADGTDSVTGVGVTFNQSNRFRRFGGYFETGERGSQPSHYFSLNGSRRLPGRIDVGFSYSALRLEGADSLAIVTLGWEMSRTRSLTGRFVQRNGKQNGYLAFRNGGLKGTELYVILGDPNAQTFQRRVSVKLVWAF